MHGVHNTITRVCLCYVYMCARACARGLICMCDCICAYMQPCSFAEKACAHLHVGDSCHSHCVPPQQVQDAVAALTQLAQKPQGEEGADAVKQKPAEGDAEAADAGKDEEVKGTVTRDTQVVVAEESARPGRELRSRATTSALGGGCAAEKGTGSGGKVTAKHGEDKKRGSTGLAPSSRAGKKAKTAVPQLY